MSYRTKRSVERKTYIYIYVILYMYSQFFSPKIYATTIYTSRIHKLCKVFMALSTYKIRAVTQTQLVRVVQTNHKKISEKIVLFGKHRCR
jgi:hypothetical protein